MQQHRHRDVVGQVGHQRCGHWCANIVDVLTGDLQRILHDQPQLVGVVGGAPDKRGGKLSGKAWVDLHGRDVLHRIDQREGQRPQTRANLQHMILGGYLCGGNDPADGVGIMNEVLTQLLCRPNIELIRQLPNLRRPEQR